MIEPHLNLREPWLHLAEGLLDMGGVHSVYWRMHEHRAGAVVRHAGLMGLIRPVPHRSSSSLNDVYGRLVLLFNEVSVPQGDGTRLIVERLTHKQIAGRLGCSREMVSRLIKDLEGRYLVVEDSHYRLLRPLPSRW